MKPGFRLNPLSSRLGSNVAEYAILAILVGIAILMAVLAFGKTAQAKIDGATGIMAGANNSDDTIAVAVADPGNQGLGNGGASGSGGSGGSKGSGGSGGSGGGKSGRPGGGGGGGGGRPSGAGSAITIAQGGDGGGGSGGGNSGGGSGGSGGSGGGGSSSSASGRQVASASGASGGGGSGRAGIGGAGGEEGGLYTTQKRPGMDKTQLFMMMVLGFVAFLVIGVVAMTMRKKDN